MSFHPQVERLLEAGFDMRPLLSTSGIDDGLLFCKWTGNRTHIDVVTAWADGLAASARLPNQRDWTFPFTPTRPWGEPGTTFVDAVDRVLRLPPLADQ